MTDLEKELAEHFVDWLKKLSIITPQEEGKEICEHVHIPNRASKNRPHTGLKNFPDHHFPYGNRCYMVELGIKNRHSDRKKNQLRTMMHWQINGGVSVNILKTIEEIDTFFKEITNR